MDEDPDEITPYVKRKRRRVVRLSNVFFFFRSNRNFRIRNAATVTDDRKRTIDGRRVLSCEIKTNVLFLYKDFIKKYYGLNEKTNGYITKTIKKRLGLNHGRVL